MKLEFRNLDELLHKLNAFNFNRLSDTQNALIGEYEGREVEVAITTKLANSYHDIDHMPVQTILRVAIDGVHVTFWGAEDSKACSKMVKWYQVAKAKATDTEYKLKRQREDEAKEFFAQIVTPHIN